MGFNNLTEDEIRVGKPLKHSMMVKIKENFSFMDRGRVLVATTENITLSGAQTIDGVMIETGKVLVKDQTDKSENGIYLVREGAWVRDPETSTPRLIHGLIVNVENGNTNSGKSYICHFTGDPFFNSGFIGFELLVFQIVTSDSLFVKKTARYFFNQF